MSNNVISKYDYFIGSLKDNAHYSRQWMLRAFTVCIGQLAKEQPWDLKHTDTEVLVLVPTDGQLTWMTLEGCTPMMVPYVYHDATGKVKAGDVGNLSVDLSDSTWGDLLFNARTLVYACGNRIPYQVGPVDLKAVEAIFANNIADDPTGEDDPEQLYVKHWIAFGKSIADLAGYEFFVPSVSEHALQPPPGLVEFRTKLLEENKDQLDDPVIQSRIQDALVDMYKEYIKGDPSEGFLYNKKSMNTAIKRMFLIHGPEAGFSEGGRATLVVNSLLEGLDFDKYPAMVNSLRAGSYYRGAMTALAGEDVDLMGRVFQNARIQIEFCNTTSTFELIVSKRHMGRYLDISGERVEITEENLPKYQGQLYGMYSPAYCEAPHSDVCSICIGKKLAAYKDSLAAMVNDMPSTMMSIMMGSAHAKELKTTQLDIDNFLR